MNMLPSNENTNEMSAGSQPVAWAVVQSECWSVYLTRLDANRAATHGLGELVPLYRQPQPTLTGEERKALEGMLNTIMYEPDKIAVKSILSRFG